MTIESILEPAGGCTIQSHRETCRLRPRQQIGTVRIGRREVGILGILHGLKIRVFSEFRTSFGCREINFQTIDGRCEQNTHSYSMYRCAQCVTTSHCTVGSLFITRTRVAQGPNGSSLGVPKIVCHPRVMSRSLPHLTPTTSTCSLSPTSPIFPTFSPPHSSLLAHDPYLPCDD